MILTVSYLWFATQSPGIIPFDTSIMTGTDIADILIAMSVFSSPFVVGGDYVRS